METSPANSRPASTCTAATGLVLVIAAILWGYLFLNGCAGRPVQDRTPVPPPFDTAYAGFWKANQQDMDRIYADSYEPYDFIVDTDRGSRPIQQLADPRSVLPVLRELASDTATPGQIIRICLNYIHRHFEYRPAPNQWPTMAETLRSGKADCKGLSLLLLTLLSAAGVDSYGAISNGHMWVVAHDGKKWRVLETDTDPGRQRFYRTAGFYERPLFKIRVDGAFKRKRKSAN